MPAAAADSISGAASQCAEMTSTARGLGMVCVQAASCDIHSASSSSGGAPWPMYSAGSAPSDGSQARCAADRGPADTANSSYAPAGTSGSKMDAMIASTHDSEYIS